MGKGPILTQYTDFVWWFRAWIGCPSVHPFCHPVLAILHPFLGKKLAAKPKSRPITDL